MRQPARFPAVRVGLIVGGILVGLNVLYLLVQLFLFFIVDSQSLSLQPNTFIGIAPIAMCLLLTARVSALFLAGLFTAQRTESLGSAGGAGMLAAALDGASSIALTAASLALWPDLAYYTQVNSPGADVLVQSAFLLADFDLIAGGLLGMLGWLVFGALAWLAEHRGYEWP